MRNPPASVVWSWPEPNFINPEYKSDETLFGVCVSLLVLAAIAVALRLYVRIAILHNTGLDDWFVLAAIFPSIGLTTAAMMGTRFGWGLHIWDNKPEWFHPSLLCSWISQLLFIITMVLVKLSICFSYRRLSLEKPFKSIVNGTAIFIVLWGVAFTVTAIFRCWPVSGYWFNITMKQHNCVPENGPLMASSITNIASDFWLVILPVPMLWRLQLPTRQRVILIGLMALGLIACTCGITRTFYAHKTLFDTYDVTWEGYYVWLWTMAECDLAIFCTSIPPLRPLIKRHFPRVLDKRRSRALGTFISGPLTITSKRDTLVNSASAFSPIHSPIKGRFDMDLESIESASLSTSPSRTIHEDSEAILPS